MRIGSLFSGIGGLELGLERAILGAHTVWQVEKDEYARKVLAKHWPRVKRYNNVEQVGAHNLEQIDLLCAGWPCQDISPAGKKSGLEGPKSGLWKEVRRIAGDLQPRYLVLENSSALLTRGFGDVLGDLAALGYDVFWECIPAASVGAPISGRGRDRIFIVAFADSDRCLWSRLPREPGGELLASVAGGDSAFTGIPSPAPNHWKDLPQVRRVSDGVPNRVDRIRCIGNAVVPQVAELVGRLIVRMEEQ